MYSERSVFSIHMRFCGDGTPSRQQCDNEIKQVKWFKAKV